MINLESAEAAARLDRHVRMDMIQLGYNPMNSQDVQNFYNNKPPLGLMKELITHNLDEGVRINNMGEKAMNISADMAAIKTAINEGDANIDMQHFRNSPQDEDFYNATNVNWDNITPIDEITPQTNPNQIKSNLASQINYTPKNVNEKLKTVLNNTQTISLPKQVDKQTNKLTEKEQALKLGYSNGCSYLTAFINLLKNPTSENRIKLIQTINKMVLAEDNIHSSITL